MPPRGTVTWRRPHTAIYNDNYRYGTGLYSDTLSGCQKKRSDRPESSLSTYSLAKTSTPVAEECHHVSASLPPLSPVAEMPPSMYKGSVFENLMNSALYSSYAKDLGEDMDVQTTKKKTTITTTTATATSNLERQSSNNPVEIPRPQSLYDDANLFLTSPKVVPSKSASLVEGDTKKKRKKVTEVQITTPTPTATVTTTTSTTVNSPPQNGPSTSYWKEQCNDLQGQVDMLTQALGEVNDKLKGELSTMKGRLHTGITDLTVTLDQSSLQSNELQKTVKRQANQLLDLQSAYDDLQRHLQDSLDEVSGHQRRSQTLRKEMDRLRAEVEGTLQRSASKA